MYQLKIISFILIFLSSYLSFSQDLTFVKTWEEAVLNSKKENKNILLVLTASSWCKPCVTMKKKVFSDIEFIKYVSNNLILYKVDLGKQPLILNSPNYIHYNDFKKKYNAKKLPSLVLVNSEKKKIKTLKGKMTSLKNILYQLKKEINN